MCGTWADYTGYTGGGKVETKPQRTLVVLHESRTTDGKITGSTRIIMTTEKRTNAKKTEGMPLCWKYQKGSTKSVRSNSQRLQ